MEVVDLIVKNIGVLVTCAGAEAKRGETLREVGLRPNTAVAIDNGRFAAIGDFDELTAVYQTKEVLDGNGRVAIPGFVDCHTHVVYGGNRVHEFEMRIEGASYMEIMAAGGGIVSTMRHTREASEAQLIKSAVARLDQMLALGSTTVEVKSGYGLDTVTELKMLHVIEQLDQQHPCQLVPTFLGAHTLPPEYKDDSDAYVNLVVNEMIPEVWSWYQQSHFSEQKIPLFIDVFCEDHAFDVAQSRRILEAGLAVGMQAKIHVDQFNSLGGLEMALYVGVTSADHLEATAVSDIPPLSQSDAIAVLLPAVNFNLGLTAFAAGRQMVDGGTAVALATDMNPGSAPCFSMPLTMAIGCRYLGLTPAETLNASTLNAAHALGLGERFGSIEVGKTADLLLLDSNDYRNLTYLLGDNLVHTVIKSGSVVYEKTSGHPQRV